MGKIYRKETLLWVLLRGVNPPQKLVTSKIQDTYKKLLLTLKFKIKKAVFT